MKRKGMSPFRAGAIALAIILVGCYLGFTKDIPFTKPYVLRGVFPSANSLRKNSPVRIAGVAVGKVKAIDGLGASNAAVVTMQIDKRGLPIHADATAQIRPRIFLEGNFFVDLHPGTPSAPTLSSGDTLKITQTSDPVQLDQVLTALQADTRHDLQGLVDQLGVALSAKPTAAQDAKADPSVRGKTGAQAFNEAYDDIATAEQATAIVNGALLGTEPDRDIRRLLRGLADTTAGLDSNEVQLKDLVTNFNRTMAIFASEQNSLKGTIHELGPTLQSANGALAKLNDAFPATRAFAHEILPGVRETPATIDAGFPWVAQTRKLLSQAELRGLARNLSPASRDLAKLVRTSSRLFPQADLVAKCATDVILPTGDVQIKDQFADGSPNYREFFYALVGLSGESQNADGNGGYVRFQPGGGSTLISLGQAGSGGGALYGNGFPGGGDQPKKPAKPPPYNAGTPCYQSKLPDLNGPWAASSNPTQPAAARSAARTIPADWLHPFGGRR